MSINNGDTLIVAGYANVDLIAYLPGGLKPGGRLTVHEIEEVPGGMAANCSCTAAKLGTRVIFFGILGDDEYGHMMLTNFKKYGVETKWIKIIKQRRTTKCLIYVLPSGERCIISEFLHFDYEPLKTFISSRELSKKIAVLHFDGYRLNDFSTVVEMAKDRKIMISADLDGISTPFKNVKESLKFIDIALMNKSIMFLITNEGSPEKALPMIGKLGPQIVVVTAGADGAWIYTKNKLEHVKGYKVSVQDTTGAGDVFDGAFLHKYIQTEDAFLSLKYANAAAAISTTGKGALGHLPDEKETMAILYKNS